MWPGSGFGLRSAHARELERLRAVEAAALSAYADLDGYQALAGGAVRDLAELERGLSEGALIVAEADGAIVAFAMTWRVDHRAHLTELAVDPGFQRKGIGAALVAEAVGRARAAGHAAMTLTCYRDVPWNAPWYRRLGWRDIALGRERPGLAAIVAEETVAGYAIQPRLTMERVL